MQKHKLVNYWKRWSRPERCGKKIHNKKKKKTNRKQLSRLQYTWKNN